jgi:hypothetical protein
VVPGYRRQAQSPEPSTRKSRRLLHVLPTQWAAGYVPRQQALPSPHPTPLPPPPTPNRNNVGTASVPKPKPQVQQLAPLM